ncbi:hypothetical protein PENSPDRAFT_102839 [Peniophora sp. CONT]|nr:hypothetical protein PENSPDRAFT_102839 [Peniophora sp. CONT]
MSSAKPIFPFHALPPEILDTILLLATLDDCPRPGVYDHDRRVFYNDHKSDHTGRLSNEHVWRPVLERGSLGWIRLSHVCRLWRDILMERKSLWASILGTLPLGEGEMFKRAGKFCPFDITVTAAPFHRQDSTVLHFFKPTILSSGGLVHSTANRNRLRSLHIADMREAFGGHLPLEALFSSTLPGLEELGIHFLGPTDEAIWFASEPLAIVNAPRLHTLKLINGFIRWKSNTLRCFSMNCYNGQVPSRDLLLEFMEMLRDTIEELELLYCFGRDLGLEAQSYFTSNAQQLDAAIAPHMSKISFPRLRTLHIADDRDNMAGFLLRASPPPDVHITVELYVEIEDGEWATQNQKAEVERNIRAALRCGNYGASLDGLALRPGIKKDELVIDIYTSSLTLFQASRSSTNANLFNTRHPSLTLSVLNAASFHLRDLSTSFSSITSFLTDSSPSSSQPSMRFTTLSIDMPHWRPNEIQECMKPFTKLRALRIVNPLDKRNLPRVPDTPSPYLNALEPEAPLEMLWFVQKARTYEFSYLSCALILSRQLRATFEGAGGFRLKRLRVDYLVEISKEDEREVGKGKMEPRELFGEFADVVEWKTGTGDA